MEAPTLRSLFTKPCGAPAPSAAQWRALDADDVHFQDPTREHAGIEACLQAQEGLLKRCDDVSLVPGGLAMAGDVALIEWEMGLKIKGIEFLYPGATRLRLNGEGKICDHRDSFVFVAPTFGLPPGLGGFVRWLSGCVGCLDDL